MQYNLAEIARITNGKLSNNTFADQLIQHVETDSRYLHSPKQTLFIALRGTRFDGHQFIPDLMQKNIACVIVSDNTIFESLQDYPCILVEDTLKALQAIASFHRQQFHFPIIGITGSNGKTTIKEWLSILLNDHFKIVKNPKSYNSQIGVPLSVLLLDKKHTLGIFEAGISQHSEMQHLHRIIQPTIGIISNIGDAHASGFDSIEQKIHEKLQLFGPECLIIYSKDETRIDQQLKTRNNVFTWSSDIKIPADVQIIHSSQSATGLLITLNYLGQSFELTLPFNDEASLENVMHCICTLLYLNIPVSYVQQQVHLLTALPMRMEQKEGVNQCILINDSYSLDLRSLELAFRFLDQQNTQLDRCLIVSDFAQYAEGVDQMLRHMAHLCTQYRISKIICIGTTIQALQTYLSKHITWFHYYTTQSFLQDVDNISFQKEVILIKGARSYHLESVFRKLALYTHDTVLEIDLKALSHNYNYFKSILLPGVQIIAVVKAAAYGSGQYEIAKYLEGQGVPYLAVAYLDEGIILRQKGIKIPIIVMNAGNADWELYQEYQIEPEIFANYQLQSIIAQTSSHAEFPIHLKLESGMHRLGFQTEEIEECIQLLAKNPHITIRSIFSHLSSSDMDNERDYNIFQANEFEKQYVRISEALHIHPKRHLLNSGGIKRYPQYQYDYVRLGIGLYGFESSVQQELEKVHQLKTKISQIKVVPAGSYIGYSKYAYASLEMRIAVLSIGYADGLPRILGSKQRAVMIHGKFAPLVGHVCMDMCMVDVSHIPSVQAGDDVLIFGQHLDLVELAKEAGTIPYEILCGIGPRVKRIFLQD